MKSIETEFVVYKKKNEQAGSHTQSKPKNIDERIALVFEQIAEGDFEIVFVHDQWIIKFEFSF